jgi:hypothetical protein
MRSNQKSTISKPRLLRAFQGPVTNNPCPFKGLDPYFTVSIWVPQLHPVSPGSQKPRSVAGIPHRAVPGPYGQSPLHQPDRRGVLAAPTPQTRPNQRNPCNRGTFAQRDRARHGVPEPGCGVVPPARSAGSSSRGSLPAADAPRSPEAAVDSLSGSGAKPRAARHRRRIIDVG